MRTPSAWPGWRAARVIAADVAPAVAGVAVLLWLVLAGVHDSAPVAALSVCVLGLVGVRLVLAVRSNRATTRDLTAAALSDPLTGLPNRRALMERLDRAHESGTPEQLLFIDLDAFKQVNDLHGHVAGDRLLVAVADRFREVLPPDVMAARVAGDEFAVALSGERGRGREIAQILTDVLDRPYDVLGRGLRMTASVGGAGGDVALTAQALLREAGLALKAAKVAGKNRWVWFDESVAVPAQRRDVVERGLREAVVGRRFVLALQPIVRLEDYSVIGVEALLRWRHPELGLVRPDEFIGVAEDNGTIHELGRHVLELAARAGAKLGQFGWEGWVSVNVSPVQLIADDFVDRTHEVIERTGLSHDRLVLEIAESRLARYDDYAAELDRLRLAGVRVAIDDFGGADESAMWRLPELGVDMLKLDPSLAAGAPREERVAALVEAVGVMAKRMNLQLVAEGVETFEQSVRMRDLGVPAAQGYLFARALDVDGIAALLRNVMVDRRRGEHPLARKARRGLRAV